MSQNYDDSKQPKSIRYHSYDYLEVMQMFMGLNDADQGFDHFFLMCDNWMKFMDEVVEAIKQEVIKTTIKINEDAISRLHNIWEGPLYLEVRRAGFYAERVIERVLHCDGKRPEPKTDIDELIELPSLQDMNPVSGIRENRMLVRIRALVPVKYAFESLDVPQLVTAGRMFYDFKTSQEPIFKDDFEIINSDAHVMVVGRPYFHKVVNIEKRAFLKYFNIVYINFHKILEEKMSPLSEKSGESEYIPMWDG